MSTVADVLDHALTLPPADRASLVHSLIQSLPAPPRMIANETELAALVERRIQALADGTEQTFDAAESVQRAREALRKLRP